MQILLCKCAPFVYSSRRKQGISFTKQINITVEINVRLKSVLTIFLKRLSDRQQGNNTAPTASQGKTPSSY